MILLWFALIVSFLLYLRIFLMHVSFYVSWVSKPSVVCSNLKLKLKYSLSKALLHYHKVLYVTQLDFSRNVKALILWVKNIMLGLYCSLVAEFFGLNIQDIFVKTLICGKDSFLSILFLAPLLAEDQPCQNGSTTPKNRIRWAHPQWNFLWWPALSLPFSRPSHQSSIITSC